MSKDEEVIALAERCEAATGPDAQLDLDIEVVVGGYALGKAPPDFNGANESEIYIPAGGVPKGFTYPPKGAIGRYYHVTRRAYTASIDAAMTLVPEGCERINLEQVRMQDGSARNWASVDGWPASPKRCATPALALCAAALRARAALAQKGSIL